MIQRSFVSRRSAALFICSLGLLFSAGCGGSSGLQPEGPTGTVTGKVTWKGAPLTSGTVTFVNAQQGLAFPATIGPDGGYSLSGPFGTAIPVGDYQVGVAPAQTQMDPAALMQPMGQPEGVQPAQDSPGEIPLKFRSPDMSGIIKTVAEGANDITVDIPE